MHVGLALVRILDCGPIGSVDVMTADSSGISSSLDMSQLLVPPGARSTLLFYCYEAASNSSLGGNLVVFGTTSISMLLIN